MKEGRGGRILRHDAPRKRLSPAEPAIEKRENPQGFARIQVLQKATSNTLGPGNQPRSCELNDGF